MPWSPLPTPDGRGRPPQPLSEGLDRVLASLGAPPADVFSRLRDGWAHLVGPEAAAALVPVAIEGRTVLAVTTSAAWASQARWIEPGLVERAAEMFGTGVVEGLKVRVRRDRG